MCRDLQDSYPRVVAYGPDDLFEVSKRRNQQETTVSLDMFRQLWVGSPWSGNAGSDHSVEPIIFDQYPISPASTTSYQGVLIRVLLRTGKRR
jgi:hypothetical protein